MRYAVFLRIDHHRLVLTSRSAAAEERAVSPIGETARSAGSFQEPEV